MTAQGLDLTALYLKSKKHALFGSNHMTEEYPISLP